MKKYLIGIAMIFVFCVCCAGTALALEDSEQNIFLMDTGAVSLDLSAGSITISAGENGAVIFTQGGTMTESADGKAIIRQTNSGVSSTANTIAVESGAVELTIIDLNVVSSEAAPISVQNGASLTLNLLGSSTLNAGRNHAGVQVPDGASLFIQGSGAVNATGGFLGAGIGGGDDGSGGIITISGGTVTAAGSGAGIGGGYGGSGGTITISGGTITAISMQNDGAGIGGGKLGSGGTITISDGTVTARGRGAGIGGGYDGSGGTITISGGTVTATSDYHGAGIGGGEYGSGGTIIISGGLVTATGSGVGIGGGYDGSGGIVEISNAEVNAYGYYHAIGGGDYENQYGCDSITIADNAVMTLGCIYDDSYSLEQYTDYQEKILYEPAILDSAALLGNNALFPTSASGHSGVSYQWQTSSDGKSWEDLPGQTSAEGAVPMSAENDGCYVRCKITNGWGNVVYTDAARAYILAFTQQPQSVELNVSDMASLSVISSCANVAYQWQRSYDDGNTWTDVSGENYATLIVNATLSENDALYRCVITATNGDQLASESAKITVNSTAVTYTTNLYLEKADGSGYELYEKSVLESTPGTEVTAAEKTYEHYTENTGKGTLRGTVKADSSLTLSRYFDRDTYAITFETNGGSALPQMTAKYEAPVSLPIPSRTGCTFSGWYSDAALTEAFTSGTMPGEDTTLYAKWTAVGEGRGIEYKINGITLRDSSYQRISSIPKGTFYAEVSVTNLSSETMDTLLLATYDRDGKMLGLSFLYANPQIGQTFVLGTSFDNSRGEIAKIKAFMLPMLGGLTPLAEAAEIG